jgi:hypothetical protein
MANASYRRQIEMLGDDEACKSAASNSDCYQVCVDAGRGEESTTSDTIVKAAARALRVFRGYKQVGTVEILSPAMVSESDAMHSR